MWCVDADVDADVDVGVGVVVSDGELYGLYGGSWCGSVGWWGCERWFELARGRGHLLVEHVLRQLPRHGRRQEEHRAELDLPLEREVGVGVGRVVRLEGRLVELVVLVLGHLLGGAHPQRLGRVHLVPHLPW
jgi:hypothetical protein